MHSTEISVPASISALPELSAQLVREAACVGMPDGVVLRLQLVVEELFINAVTHGQAEGFVRVSLFKTDAGWCLNYRDSGAAFDPFGQINSPAVDIEKPGGLGLELIRGMSQEGRYERCQQENLVLLLLKG